MTRYVAFSPYYIYKEIALFVPISATNEAPPPLPCISQGALLTGKFGKVRAIFCGQRIDRARKWYICHLTAFPELKCDIATGPRYGQAGIAQAIKQTDITGARCDIRQTAKCIQLPVNGCPIHFFPGQQSGYR